MHKGKVSGVRKGLQKLSAETGNRNIQLWEQQEQLFVLGQTESDLKKHQREPEPHLEPPLVCSQESPCFVPWLLNHPSDSWPLGKEGAWTWGVQLRPPGLHFPAQVQHSRDGFKDLCKNLA